MNNTGLTNNFSVNALYFNITAAELPIPTDWLGFNDNVITSLPKRLWFVETETVVSIFSTVPVTWVKLDSKVYSKLLVVALKKNSPPARFPVVDLKSESWVVIPM